MNFEEELNFARCKFIPYLFRERDKLVFATKLTVSF